MRLSDRNQLDAIRSRLASHLAVANRKYPRAWRQLDEFRARRKELGDWPDWCFCPLSGAYAIVSGGRELRALGHYTGDEDIDQRMPIIDVARIGCLGAWRTSQGIYWIDENLRQAVLETPSSKEIPVDILLELPQWSVYIALPGETHAGGSINGFFAFLESDESGRMELRIMIDFSDGIPYYSLRSEILHLVRGETLEKAHDRALQEGLSRLKIMGIENAQHQKAISVLREEGSKRLEPLLSCLLYICSKTAEFRGEGETNYSKPKGSAPKKTKDGWRFFPPDRPKVWYVGERLGQAIREVHETQRTEGATRSGPRPHVRRAHWHTYWVGPHDSPARHPELKWLPPFAVALADDSPAARMKHGKLTKIGPLDKEMDAAANLLGGNDA